MTKARFEIEATDKTKDAFRSVEAGLQGVTSKFTAAAGAIGVAFGAAELVQFSRQAIASTAELGRMSRALGASAEDVQVLTYTFRQFNAEQDDVADALATLADRALDAVHGAKSMQEDFALVGLRVDDLRGKRPDELFRLFAQAVSETHDPTQRAAAVVRTLGDDLGRKLMPLLLEGSAGLDRYARAAHDAGQVMSDELVDAAEDVDRKFKDLMATMETAAKTAVVNWARILKLDDDPIRDLEERLAGLRAEQDRLLNTIQSGRNPIGDRLSPQLLDGLKQRLNDVNQQMIEAQQHLQKLTNPDAPAPTGTGGGSSGGGQQSADQAAKIQAVIDKLKEEAETYGLTAEAVNVYHLRQLGATAGQIREAEAIAAKIGGLRQEEETRKALAQAETERQREVEAAIEQIDRESEARLSADQREQDSHGRRLAMLQYALDNELITIGRYDELKLEQQLLHDERLAEIKAAQRERERNDLAAHQGSLLGQQLGFISQLEAAQKASGARQVGIYANAFASITAAGAQHSKTLFEINKIAGISNAVVSTYQGAAKALELGWPLGPIAAAAIVASGMAQVAAISSTQYGSSTAPSVGATPAPPVTPVSGSGQTSGQGGGSSTQQINVTVNGSVAGDLKEFALMIGDAIKDEINAGDYVMIDNTSRQGRMLAAS